MCKGYFKADNINNFNSGSNSFMYIKEVALSDKIPLLPHSTGPLSSMKHVSISHQHRFQAEQAAVPNDKQSYGIAGEHSGVFN